MSFVQLEPLMKTTSQRVGDCLKSARKMMNNKRKGRRAQGQVEQKAKLDSAIEIMSPYDAVQLPMAAEEAPPL